jgi:hypothetical protein
MSVDWAIAQGVRHAGWLFVQDIFTRGRLLARARQRSVK